MSPQLDFLSKTLSFLQMVMGADLPAPAMVTREPTGPPDVMAWSAEHSLQVSHTAEGSIRRENPLSGVVEEQHADGSLTVSLPHGKYLAQCFEGAPLLVMDLDEVEPGPDPPLLARVMNARIGEEARLIYHYEDPDEGHFMIEVDSLRHFHSRRPPVSVPEGAAAAAHWTWV